MQSQDNQTTRPNSGPNWTKPLYGRKAFSAALEEKTGVKVSPRQLEKLAVSGDSPPYVIFARRAYYDLEQGIAWVQSRMSAPRRSTSEGRRDAA
jgi:hypothetical protein